MAYRPPHRSRGDAQQGAPAPAPARSDPNAVPYYHQSGREMREREHYDNYAFPNPDAYDNWRSSGQREGPRAPASSMPRPRDDVYPPWTSQPSRSFPGQAGPSRKPFFNPGYPSDPAPRPYSTDRNGSSSYDPTSSRSAPVARRPSPPPARDARGATPQFVIPLPSDEYMKLSEPRVPTAEERLSSLSTPNKLLVLDLNGTLIYRNKGSASGRTSYPRPYLKNFLDYLLQVEDEQRGTSGIGKWSVFVWSSAQPHNVRGMLESTFGARHLEGLWDGKEPDEYERGRVLGVWARDKMGLSAHEYANKTQTVKDLRKIADHFAERVNITGAGFRVQDILLLDDSPRKAVHQPWNQVVLPEYDRALYQNSREAIQRGRPGKPAKGCDQYLLAIIGMLEELNSVSNIPAWIRGGALKHPDALDADEPCPADGPAAGETPTLEQLPSHDDFRHWFQDPKAVGWWIDKGKMALEARNIPLDHSIDVDASARPSPSPFSPEPSSRASRQNTTAGHAVPARRAKGYSPSRPTEPIADAPEDDPSAERARSASIEHDKEAGHSSLPSKPSPSAPHAPSDRRSPSPSRVHPRSPRHPPSTQMREFTTVNPNPNLNFAPTSELYDQSRPVDTWRMLRSADVSRWLADVADRALIGQQDRTLLHQAGDLLAALGTDDAWDRRMPPEMLRLGGWHDDMTDAEVARQGELRALYQTREMVGQAKENGLPPNPHWLTHGQKNLRRLQGESARRLPKSTDDQGKPLSSKKSERLRTAINLGKRTEETLESVPHNFSWLAKPEGSTWAAATDTGEPLPLSARHAKMPLGGEAGLASQHQAHMLFDGHDAAEAPGSEHAHPGAEDGDPDDVVDHTLACPLDYPSSRLQLPPIRINDRVLTSEEIARFFARAKENHSDAYQGQYLREIEKRENKILTRGGKITMNDSDMRRVNRLRGWVFRAEDQRDKHNERARERRRQLKEAEQRGEPVPPMPPLPKKNGKKDPELQKRRQERARKTKDVTAKKKAKKIKSTAATRPRSQQQAIATSATGESGRQQPGRTSEASASASVPPSGPSLLPRRPEPPSPSPSRAKQEPRVKQEQPAMNGSGKRKALEPPVKQEHEAKVQRTE